MEFKNIFKEDDIKADKEMLMLINYVEKNSFIIILIDIIINLTLAVGIYFAFRL